MYVCFFLKMFHIIHQSNQNMKTNFDNILRLQNASFFVIEFLNNFRSEDVNCCQKMSIKYTCTPKYYAQVVKKHKFLALIVANARLFLRKWSILDRYQVHHLCLVYKLQQQLRGKLKNGTGSNSQSTSKSNYWLRCRLSQGQS